MIPEFSAGLEIIGSDDFFVTTLFNRYGTALGDDE
jgi:hypothetical protein